MRAKYRFERDRRARPQGVAQNRAPVGALADYDVDPFAGPPVPREPLTDEVDVVILGAGFAGLLAAAAFRAIGVERIRVIDRAADFGGTWYWNRYPGAQCDVESYVYLPLLEETGFVPTERYARGPEIFEHARRIARHLNLYRDACLQTRVAEIEWDEAGHRWIVPTDRGDRMRARYVVKTGGFLSRPKLPGIPGIETFRGHAFHTCRWDYDYTGGDPTGDLTGLAGKRVGVIGTGASAIQCIPHIAAHAEQVYVFQRTPSSVDERNNKPTDPDWARSLEPGWQRRRMDNFNILMSGGYQEENLVNDAWTRLISNVAVIFGNRGPGDSSPEEAAELAEVADLATMNTIRSRVVSAVTDPQTAEALKPYYRQFCKRPCFSDEYLPTFNRPNVRLVDLTDAGGIDRIDSSAVVVGDESFAVDCLVFATGFELGQGYSSRAEFDAVGVDGLRLSTKWAHHLATFHGLQANGFPNLFFVGPNQTGVTLSFPHSYREQADHLAHILQVCTDKGFTRMEATSAAESAWVAEMQRAAESQRPFFESCTPGWYNNEGNLDGDDGLLVNTLYGDGPLAYFAQLAAWRDQGGFEGLDFE
jgi:cyclohexanone monooxygenase